MSKSRAEKAVAYFNEGFNCAQAVLAAYCDVLGMDEQLAKRIACGFGAGMGRRQETCGAVTGAYLLVGLKHGNVKGDDAAAKEKTYAVIQEFAKRFEARNKTTNCRDLLGVDLINGDRTVAVERVKTICPNMVRDAAEVVEELLFAGEDV